MSNSRQRQYSLGYFNLARGFGTVIIILGHSMALFLNMLPAVEVPPVFAGAGRVIGGGVMAMFFMISGFYFSRRSPGRCFAIQSRLLMKPYYLTGAAIFLFTGIRMFLTGKSFVKKGTQIVMTFLFGYNAAKSTTFLGMPIGTVSIFWFVLALFGGWILFNQISFISSPKIRGGCVVACVIVSRILVSISSLWPMAIPMALLAVAYIAAGYEIRNRQLLDRKLPGWVWGGILSVTLICLAFGYVDIAACKWKLGLVDMAGSFCVGYLLLRLYCILMRLISGKRILRIIEHLGMNSIWVLCLHALEKEVIPWQDLSRVFPDQPYLCMLVCIIGRLVVVNVLFKMLVIFRRAYRRLMRPAIVLTDDEEEKP